MKLLIQSDDYGITKAAAAGIIEAIRNGIIRNTGIFTNMPWAAEVAEWIKPYMNDIALGIDLNVSTGTAILPASEIPSLVQEDGISFLTSSQNRKLDETAPDHDHVVYEDVYKEFDAQIQRYIELFGKKPDYLHGHAYGTKTTEKVRQDLAKKYDVPYSVNVMHREDCHAIPMGQYIYPSTVENQLKMNTAKWIMEDAKILESDKDFAFMITHCGYVDQEIMNLSSFNICRMKDLAAVTSDEVKQWVKDNHIELITYKDLH